MLSVIGHSVVIVEGGRRIIVESVHCGSEAAGTEYQLDVTTDIGQSEHQGLRMSRNTKEADPMKPNTTWRMA